MKIDQYGQTSIASIYYDTPDYRLIRTSIEKPPYKEKIRLRSYGLSKPGGTVFLELKRKTAEIVYKRRVVTTEESVNKFFAHEGGNITTDGQIAREITYCRDYYDKLMPTILIIYDRTAYYQVDGDLRLTIDRNPRYRTKDLNLTSSLQGTSLLPDGGAILEVKVQQSIPLWLSKILSKGQIYQGSFSKVGEAYKLQMKQLLRERS